MHGRAFLLLALGLSAACTSESEPTAEQVQDDPGEGFSLSGSVYGFTSGPDSNRVALEGVTLRFVRIGDIVEWPDTTVAPDTLPGGDTLLTSRFRPLLFRSDTVDTPPHDTVGTPPNDTTVTPPDTVVTPPGSCSDGDATATATTGADGKFTAEGLEDGIYAVWVSPGTGSPWQGRGFCPIQLTADRPDPFDLYLLAAP